MSTVMAAETAEQPRASRATLDGLLPLRAEVVARFAGRRRVLLAARGTSDNAAVYGRYLLETYAGIPASLLAPSVATHYGARLDLSDSLVVSLSQSGATQEIVATQEWARECGAATLAVANEAESPLVAGADLAMVTRAGPERAVPATKTYLCQLVAMAVLATALAPTPDALDHDLARVPDEVERMLAVDVAEAVETLEQASYAVVAGRGLMLGTALETALKLEETCLRPVRGYSYADLRHGPISVVTEGTAAVLVCAGDGPMVAPMTELAHDLRGRGARVVGVGGDAGFAAAVDVALPGPDLPEALAPLGSIVVSQVVVEQLARALGLDPDNPRGLAKVTATEPPSKEQ